MEPRNEKKEPKTTPTREPGRRPKLQVIKLEERIAPRITQNHNETLVGDRPAKAR